MAFENHFDNKIRFLVIHQDVTKKPTTIQKYKGINLRSIYSWIEKTEQNINILERQKGQGGPPEIADDLKENIARAARRKPHRSSTRKLGNQYKVAKTTVNKILTEKEFKCTLSKVITRLTKN